MGFFPLIRSPLSPHFFSPSTSHCVLYTWVPSSELLPAGPQESFFYLGTQNNMGRYGFISIEEGKGLSTCWLYSCPCSPDAIGSFCHKRTLLTHILLVFYMDSEVFVCKAAFWIGSPKASLFYGITDYRV